MMTAWKNLEVHGLTFNETRELGSSFDTAESGSSPCPSGNQLESIRRVRINARKVEAKERSNLRPSGNLLPCSGDANNGRNSPSLMASLEGGTHDVNLDRPALASGKRPEEHSTNISGGVKGEIQPSVGDLDEVILDALASWKLGWVHEVRRTELPSPSFLPGISINGDDTRGFYEGRSTDNAKANAATAEDSNSRALHSLLFDDSTPGSGNAAPEEANLLQRSGRVDSNDGDISNDRVLRERRSSHLHNNG